MYDSSLLSAPIVLRSSIAFETELGRGGSGAKDKNDPIDSFDPAND